jgi:hypothetical protein
MFRQSYKLLLYVFAKECPNLGYFALILSFVDDYPIPRKRTTDAASVMT